MKALNSSLLALIESATTLGLGELDIKNAQDFIDHGEFGLAFDTIVVQMYEYDIEIDTDLYTLIETIATKMDLPLENYLFMKELIRSDSDIPKQVKDKLVKIITGLRDESN